jgi:hypothetical protein
MSILRKIAFGAALLAALIALSPKVFAKSFWMSTQTSSSRYMIPAPTTVQISPQSTTSSIGSIITIVDRTAAITVGRTVTSFGYYSTSSETAKLKIIIRNSTGNYTVLVDQSVSHPGGGWADFALSSSYTVVGADTYLAKANTGNTGSNDLTAAVSRATISGDATGGPTAGYTENTSGAYPLRYSYY